MPQEAIRQHEDIRRAVNRLLDEIAKRPQDRVALQDALRAKVAERDAIRWAAQFANHAPVEQIDDEHDFFDNVPV